MTKLFHEELSYTVRGVLIDVHNKLGSTLPEKFYQEAITYGLRQQGITCTPEQRFEVIYRNLPVGAYYIDHWLENGKILLEIKVTPQILPIHQAQAISYLKLTNADLAIVANFGENLFQDKRLPNFLRNQTAKFKWQSRLFQNLPYSESLKCLDTALQQVHFFLGSGFIHRVYRQALMIELQYQNLNYEPISKIPIYYQNQFLGMQAVQVIKIENEVLLGAFAVKNINEAMELKMKKLLKYFSVKLGVLANFYGEQLKIVVVQ